MNLIVALGLTVAAAALEASPPDCVAAAVDPAAAAEAYEALAGARLQPLCAQAQTPASGEYRLRRTITYLPEHRWWMEIHARRQRVHVTVDDTLFEPSESQKLVSRLPPQRLLRILREEGWDDLWTAEDPVCARTTVTMEIGTVWEFVDADGYRARVGPRAQFCQTPYKEVVHDVSELLDEVVIRTGR